MAKHTAAVIVIGDEILRGQICDTNSSYIANNLYVAGFKLLKVIVLPDNIAEIANEVSLISKRYSTVFTCGGVGPTHDDVTYQAIAKAFNLQLEVNDELLNLYSEDLSITEGVRRFATVPASSEIIKLKGEYFPLKFAVVKVKNVYVLPGSPKYCRLAVTEIMSKQFVDTVPYSTAVDVALTELTLLQILDDFSNKWKKSVSVGSYPQAGTKAKTTITLEGNHEDVVNAKKDLINLLEPSAIMQKANFSINDSKRVLRSVLTQSHIRKAYNLLEYCYNTYNPSEIFLSFNGGKDCTVVLHLAATVLRMRGADPLLGFYLTGDSFPEVDAFIERAKNYYGICLVNRDAPMKSALHSLLNTSPHLKACLMGMRSNDPGSEKLQPLTMTDHDWPRIMRINPILDWSYKQVWDFILAHDVPYCSLYDQGYTSLGTKAKTMKNPLLQDPANPNKYLPAHSLTDDSTERQGRTVK